MPTDLDATERAFARQLDDASIKGDQSGIRLIEGLLKTVMRTAQSLFELLGISPSVAGSYYRALTNDR
jgi:hypothetical protein